VPSGKVAEIVAGSRADADRSKSVPGNASTSTELEELLLLQFWACEMGSASPGSVIGTHFYSFTPWATPSRGRPISLDVSLEAEHNPRGSAALCCRSGAFSGPWPQLSPLNSAAISKTD
jgi:hypothetical protein